MSQNKLLNVSHAHTDTHTHTHTSWVFVLTFAGCTTESERFDWTTERSHKDGHGNFRNILLVVTCGEKPSLYRYVTKRNQSETGFWMFFYLSVTFYKENTFTLTVWYRTFYIGCCKETGYVGDNVWIYRSSPLCRSGTGSCWYPEQLKKHFYCLKFKSCQTSTGRGSNVTLREMLGKRGKPREQMRKHRKLADVNN